MPFAPSSLFTGGYAGFAVDPLDLTKVFQDSAGTTGGAVGSPIGLLDDISGNGNNFSQATSAARPTLQSDGFDTNGSSTYLQLNGVDLYTPGAATFVFRVQGAAGQLDCRILGMGNSGSTGLIYEPGTGTDSVSSGNLRYFVRTSVGTVLQASATGGGLDGTWHTVAITDTGSQIDLYIDGTHIESKTYSRGTNSQVNDRTALGCLVRTSAGNFFNGRIGRVIGIARVLSGTDLTNATNWVSNSAPAGATGTVAATEAADTASASGSSAITGTAAATEASDTASITGTSAITGTASATEASDSIAIAGALAVTGALSSTEGSDTASSAGSVSLAASGAITEASDSAAASGTATIAGTSAITEAADSCAASGSVVTGNAGTAAITEANDNAAVAGSSSVAGSAVATETADASAAAGALGITGSASIAEGADTAAASGSVGNNGISGSVAVTEAADSAASSGTLSVSGSGTLHEAADASNGTGATVILGTFSANDNADTLSAAGYSGAPPSALTPSSRSTVGLSSTRTAVGGNARRRAIGNLQTRRARP